MQFLNHLWQDFETKTLIVSACFFFLLGNGFCVSIIDVCMRVHGGLCSSACVCVCISECIFVCQRVQYNNLRQSVILALQFYIILGHIWGGVWNHLTDLNSHSSLLLHRWSNWGTPLKQNNCHSLCVKLYTTHYCPFNYNHYAPCGSVQVFILLSCHTAPSIMSHHDEHWELICGCDT